MTTTSLSADRRAKARAALTSTIMGIMLAVPCRYAPAMQRVLTFEEIVQKADGVFVGTVVTQSCRFSPNGKMIFTDVQLAVTDWVGGRVAAPAAVAGGGTLVLSLAGGQMGDKACTVSDVPVLKTGQTYLIFTKLDGRPYASPITGAYQGLFKVHKDTASGQKYVTTSGDHAVTGLGDKDLLLGPRVEGVSGGVAKLKQSKGLARGFYNSAPVAVGDNPAHKASVSAVGKPSAAPPTLMPMDQFLQEIKARLKKAHGPGSAK